MTYAFARVGAVVALAVEDYFSQKNAGGSGSIKKGKLNEMPCHHEVEQYLGPHITAAGVAGRPQGVAFPLCDWKDGATHRQADAARDIWSMVRRRAASGEIETVIGCHTFRATGMTDYLTNGRRIDDLSVGEVEGIRI